MEYLKAIISATESSSEKSPHVSMVSGRKPISDPINAILLKIKEKAFDVDVFELLESDSSTSSVIKDLLK